MPLPARYADWSQRLAEVIPSRFESLADFDTYQSTPTQAVLNTLEKITGPLLVLGAGGKMGPTICQMACRAKILTQGLFEVIAVSRFSDVAVEQSLIDLGCNTVAIDLLCEQALQTLPDCENIIYLVGQKFGGQQDIDMMWKLNATLPQQIVNRFPRARFSVLSTGNVYPFVPAVTGGPLPATSVAPLGDYANSCVARERVFMDAATVGGTQSAILRLNYANELRYGVLTDIARKVWSGDRVDVTMGAVNVLWQGDACAWALAALDLAAAPARVLNLAGPELIGIRALAMWFASRFDKPCLLQGKESSTSLLSNASETHALFGYPRVPLFSMMEMVASWTEQQGQTHGKATHFEVRDGKF